MRCSQIFYQNANPMNPLFRPFRARTFAALPAVALAAAASPAAWAQGQPPVGTITYALLAASNAQPVPSLAQWGVVLLSLLMAPVAWRVARHRMACLALLGPGLLGAALLAAAAWSGQAQALPAPLGDVPLDNAAGGTADIPYHAALDTAFADYMYQYEVGNGSGQTVRITGITLTAGHTNRNPMDTPRCTVGLVLAPNETCYLLVGKPH